MSASIRNRKSITDLYHSVINRTGDIRRQAALRKPIRPAPPGTMNMAHFSIHRTGNAGDVALTHAVRRTLERRLGKVNWTKLPVWMGLRDQDMDTLNRDFEGVVVGGGGLLIADTFKNSRSGWQWAITLPHLRRLETPLIVYAIGYNRFRGQPDFPPVFQEHLIETVERSAFFSLRNHGSINSVKGYLPEHLHDKIHFQPCPTTFMALTYDFAKITGESRRLVVNLAMDRPQNRFGGKFDTFMDDIAKMVRYAQNSGWEVVFALHDRADKVARSEMKRRSINVPFIDLIYSGFDEIIEFYRRATFTVGMRGHAQMIPFGLGSPIMSIISHPKMRYFLEDIDRLEWGVDVSDRDLFAKIVARIDDMAENLEEAEADVNVIQRSIFDHSMKNLEIIHSVIYPSVPS
jgi:polysaccharide pyruvyl transferase WcaK-like protein